MKSKTVAGVCLCLILAAGLLTCCEKQPEQGVARPSSNTGEQGRPTGRPAPGRLTVEYDIPASILMEAELGQVHEPVAVFEDAAVSGGKYVLAPEGPDNKEISIGGDVACRFSVAEAGEYKLWLRVRWSGACGNSVGLTLDGADFGTVEDSVYDVWHWVPSGRRFRLAREKHLLVIANREDGAAVDQVLLTQDWDYRPTGIETAEVKNRTVVQPVDTPLEEEPCDTVDEAPT